jgi:hypothetical protein
MKWTHPAPGPYGKAFAIAFALTGVLVTTSSRTAIAQSNESASGLVGTWIVQVTLRDCATNAPRASFTSLVTFHRGGTLSESTASPAFAIGQRTDGHGSWTQQAHRTYLQRMIALILFDTPAGPLGPGFFAGWQEVTHTIDVVDASHFTSAGTNEFYRSDGTVYRTGCSTAVGQRFE